MVCFDIGETLVTGQAAWPPGAKTCLSRLTAANIDLGPI